MLNIALIPDRFAHYRNTIFKLLSKSKVNGYSLVIFADSNGKNHDIPIVDNHFCDTNVANGGIRWVNIRDFYFKNICFWQKGLFRLAISRKFDTIVYWGEAHRMSSWISALIAKLSGKEIVFWGHGIYGNESKFKLFFRKAFYKLAHKHLLYERHGKDMMVANGFDPSKLYVIFNSLNYNKHKTLLKECGKLKKADIFTFLKNLIYLF